MYYLTIENHFSSAHQLRGYKGKCENLHGHNWRVILTVRGGKLNSIGILIDFHDLKDLLKNVLSDLDHVNVNEHPAFIDQNPSSENLSRYIFEKISALLTEKGFADIITDAVTVYESDTARCTYRIS
ncbi:MAG: 6-carboxytetrahydropterin synthase QueD [Spirochaetota bacterium]